MVTIGSMSLGDGMVDFIPLMVFMSAVLCLMVAAGFYWRLKPVTTGIELLDRTISERFVHGVTAMGFSIEDKQIDKNSMLVAIADQLTFYNPSEQHSAQVVRSKAVAYIQGRQSLPSASGNKNNNIRRKKRHDEYGDDDMLHAIANAYDMTIEIIQDETLESRTIRPESYMSAKREQQRTVHIYIGHIRQSYYISLRKNGSNNVDSVDTENDTQIRSGTSKDKHDTVIHHEDVDGNKTDIVVPDQSQTVVAIGVGDNQVIECNGEYQKMTVIAAGKDNNILIPCKLRTRKENMDCALHFTVSGASVKIRLTSDVGSSDAYEDSVFRNLQENRAAFQHEVDLRLDVDIVEMKKECILLVFKPRSQDSALQLPKKFFSKEFEMVLSYIFSLANDDCTPPLEMNICLDIQFEAEERESRPCITSVATNHTDDLPIQTGVTGLSKGFSIAVRPKSQNSVPNLRLDNLQENLVKATIACIETEGLLQPSTEVEVTLQSIVLRVPKHDIYEDLDYLEAWKITGTIKGTNGMSATAIITGEQYVLTTLHFVSATDLNQIEVIFLGESKGHKLKLKLVFSSPELDVAILEIMTPLEVKNPIVYITDTNPGDDIYIVGHAPRSKNLKKERTTCLNWKNINAPLDFEKYVLFHSEKFKEGSSGAPCVKIREGKLCVVSLVIGAVLGKGQKEIAHVGVNMLTFYNLLFQQNQELCQNIFSIVYTESRICGDCRAGLRQE